LGQHHARIYSTLKKDVELVGVVDIDQSRAKSIAGKSHTQWFTDYRDLFDKQLDAVTIAVPTREHFVIASDFLRKGINVFIEKPIAVTLEEADELIALSERYDVKVQVGHVERFNPAILKLMHIIKNPK
ncbi:Gfo/Idh/MocA family oxidoreductase, partial [Arthrospira platensis SPKY1]|nr:Gfo/Idh/MocA family oxidoreductase [Arthrospira platensis SPKY1]